jgi:hypothetical protein
MKKIFFCLFVLLSELSLGQELTDAQQLTFYETTLQNFFSKQSLYTDTVLILPDSLPENLRQEYNGFFLNIVTRSQAIEIIKKRKPQSGSLYLLKKQHLSPDTLDFNIIGWGVSIERCFKFYKGHLITRNIRFIASCGGTLGYIPTPRFVFDNRQQTWVYYSNDQLVKQRLESEQYRYLRKNK